MNNLIEKILNKAGIKDLKELDPEEKQTLDSWQAVLSKDELTLEDVKKFCQVQIDFIEGRWRDYSLSNERKAELIPYHTCYKTLLLSMDNSRSDRENLEKNLLQIINQ
jgi:mRNA-degrading endonuclease HigB of HigAB toxin-antitoxin module